MSTARGHVRRSAAAAAAALALAVGCAGVDAPPPTALDRVACPSGLQAGTDCRSGRDAAGAHVWLAVPPGWTGTLVVHAHGGPELGTPRPARPVEDLQRWSIWNRAGYAYAGSGFAQGGVAVRAAADDVERSRRLFVATFGVPRRTVLHGQSWGAGVAVKTIERHRRYDAVLLTSGVLGGAGSYDFRLDLRVVWQAVCGNHPAPGEPAYPLWRGLPAEATLTRAELADRVDACTGVRQPRAARSAEQQRRLETILAVVRIPERTLAAHLAWATWHFQDIAAQRTGGGNAFGNVGVRYSGSTDDDALNARVARYPVDPRARAMLAADTELAGRIDVPVVQLHAIDDPTAFVELAHAFAERMRATGNGERLVQLYTDESEHSYLNDAVYVAAVEALLGWQGGAARPAPADVARRCADETLRRFPSPGGCRLRPDFEPAPLASRTPPR